MKTNRPKELVENRIDQEFNRILTFRTNENTIIRMLPPTLHPVCFNECSL